jgi:hypothetical protein
MMGLLMGPIFGKEKGLTAVNRKPLILLVAGTGFEPVTFGL